MKLAIATLSLVVLAALALASKGGCPGQVATCQSNLSTCQSDLSTCDGHLQTCNSDLAACQAATCGNGIAEFGEACDGENFQGETCQSQGFSYGKLACSPSCSFDTSACSNTRFVDNGDGTVIDNQTGLQWEKKDGAGGGANLANPHDVDNKYTLSSSGTAADGTAFTDFLSQLNACTSVDANTVTPAFAGHCDWRLPTIAELQTILLAPFECGTNLCIDPVFGPTATAKYWSSTTLGGFPFTAWYVFFGSVEEGSGHDDKDRLEFVRAIRSSIRCSPAPSASQRSSEAPRATCLRRDPPPAAQAGAPGFGRCCISRCGA